MTTGPTEETGFRHDFSLNGGGRAAERDLFAVAALSEFHLGGEAVLARNPLNGRTMTLAAEVLNALSYCTTFRTLDEHVAELMAGSDGSVERARHPLRPALGARRRADPVGGGPVPRPCPGARRVACWWWTTPAPRNTGNATWSWRGRPASTRRAR